MTSFRSAIRSSLYLKMMLPFIALAVVVALLVFRFLSHEATVRNERLILSLVDTTRSSISLAAEADPDISSLNRITQAIASHLKLKQVYVVSNSHTVVAANINVVIGQSIETVLSSEEQKAWASINQFDTNQTMRFYETEHYWYAISRIYLIDPNIKRLRPFLLWTKIDATDIEAQSQQDFYKVLFGALACIILFAGFKFWIQRRVIVRPLSRIALAIKNKAAIPADLIAKQENDAIGLVAQAYNQVLENTIEQEHRLELSRKYIDDITLHAPVLLAYLDCDLRIRFANKKFQQTLAPSFEHCLDHNLENVLNDDLLQQILPYANDALKGSSALFEIRFHIEDSNELAFFRVSHIPSLNTQHQVEGFFVCMEDITHLKRSEEKLAEFAAELEFNNWTLEEAKEQAEHASRAKADFLATMSHEIRTPMNGVLGMLALLKEESLNETQTQQVDIASSSAYLLMRIINDILDFSKIESGKLELDISTFNLLQLVKDTSAAQAMRAHEKSVEMILDDSELTLTEVESDSVRIQQILTNLIGNAIKFTQQGQIVIKVQNHFVDAEHAELLLSVQDSGIGIAKDKQDVIFEHFSQADTSTTRQFGGTGLGLTIVRRLCELMNGRIWVESELGCGSTFFVTLPVKIKNDTSHSALETFNLNDKVIHLVACHAMQAAIFEQELQDSNCTVNQWAKLRDLAESKTLQHSDYFIIDIDTQPLSEINNFISSYANTSILLSSFNNHSLKELGYFNKKLFKPVTTRDVIKRLLSEENQPVLTVSETQEQRPLQRILIVDDTPINQIVASKMLVSLEADIDFAANGEEALNILKDTDYDVILMDCLMPVMDGYETTRQLRSGIIPSKTNIPVIAMTANAMTGDKEKCLAAGMTSYVSKPLDKAKLIETILQVTQRA